jgi:endonuclease YncB( thermonuclease family)
MLKILVFLFVLAILVVFARWFLPIGPARVVDAGVLDVGRQRITLYGIRPPVPGEFCGGVDCREEARRVLTELVRGRYVACLPYDRDLDGVYRGVCWTDTTDINEALVRAGFAAAQPPGSAPYAPAERFPREQARGMWDVNRPRPPQQRVPLVEAHP